MKILLEKIKPDPNQPRKIIDQKSVENLAKSLKTEGLIHPIEVDKDYMIIVGEMRYRAATLLGWTEIEANVYPRELTPYERLRRQMSENLQQSGAKGGGQPMNAVDTANGWKKLYELRTGKTFPPGGMERKRSSETGRFEGDIMTTIMNEVGVPHSTVWETLELLNKQSYVIESMVKPIKEFGNKPIPRTFYREADRATEEWQEPLTKAISEGKVKRRDDIIRFANITRTKPDKAEIEFLRITEQQNAEANRILSRAVELSLSLANSTPENFSPQDKTMIELQLKSTLESIKEFLPKLGGD